MLGLLLSCDLRVLYSRLLILRDLRDPRFLRRSSIVSPRLTPLPTRPLGVSIKMDSGLSQKLLWALSSRLLNILLSPGGHGNLARPAYFDEELPDLEEVETQLHDSGLLLSLIILPSLV